MERHRELAELQRDWKPPVELSGSSSREVELSGGGKAVASLAIVLMLGAIASIVFLTREASRQAADTRELLTSGVVVDGVVTRKTRTGGEDSKHRIAYEFRHDGSLYGGSATTSKRLWAKLEVGSTVPVRFLPSRPERNHLDGSRARGIPVWLAPALSALLVATALFLVWLIRRQMQLLAEGRPAPARVVKHKSGQHGKSYTYEFPVLGGGTKKGNSGGEMSKPPAVGSTICVIYDRDNPGRNCPYPLSLVRVMR
jgi:hypothetical protein